MAQWILKANGNVVPRQSHRPMKTEEVHSEQEQMKRKVFDALIERRWGTPINRQVLKALKKTRTLVEMSSKSTRTMMNRQG
jgi:hypothetical protein